MNERDSETISGMLTEMGYQSTESKKDADIAIINTCSVRENADKRFFGMLGQLKRYKNENPDFIACVCGCMMQQQHIVDEVKKKYPWVDIIFGTHNIHNFPTLLKNVIEQKTAQIEILEDYDTVVEGLPSKRLYEHKAFVNITFGCNNFCTYCIVPFTRGREKSRKADDVVKEITRLVKDGVKEVTLLGQNVNSYRDGEITFAALLKMINEIDGLKRIKFMTSHPKDLSDDVIEAYRVCDKLCSYIHLPVQSGSDAVLKKMNRKYTREHYMSIIEKIKAVREDIAISTDIIVGFPGETEEDFEDTLKVVEDACYDSAFTFIYSVRKGTPAEKYTDQISEDVKHERFNRLVELVNDCSYKNNEKYLGKTLEVLVEGYSKNDKEYLMGRSGQNKLVNFKGDASLIGELVKVKIIDFNTFALQGEI